MSDRTMPHNLEAERAVLGAILVQHDLLAVVTPILTPSMFFRDAHRRLYQTMQRLWVSSEAVDLITVSSALRQSGELDECGGPAYISALTDGMPRGSHIESYAGIVRDLAQRRELIRMANDALANAYDLLDGQVLADIVSELGNRLVGLTVTRKSAGLVQMSEFLPAAMEAIEQASKQRGKPWGIATGFNDLDLLLGGFAPGQLIILAGRTGNGKSSLGMNIAANVAEADLGVAYFSMEMASTELVLRHLSSRGRVNSHRMKLGHLNDDEFARIAHAMALAQDLPFFLDETAGLSLFDIRARCQALKLRRKLDLIMVDYLQLMTGNAKAENRQRQVSEISLGLKNMSKDLQVPIVALSQLSRRPDARKDPRPILSDLRESGSLEQDGDVVLFIHREEVYDDSPQNLGVAELIIGKQRNGPLGSVKLAWLAQYTRFESMALA